MAKTGSSVSQRISISPALLALLGAIVPSVWHSQKPGLGPLFLNTLRCSKHTLIECASSQKPRTSARTKRASSCAGYLPIVVKECELGRIETREDMDITLQLLRKGYPNAVWQTTVNDQRGYDAPGGCTNERKI